MIIHDKLVPVNEKVFMLCILLVVSKRQKGKEINDPVVIEVT